MVRSIHEYLCMIILLPAFTLTILLIAMISDVRTGRIPNILSLIGIMGALCIIVLSNQWADIKLHLLSFLVMFVIGLFAYAGRVMGGGDAKILSFVALTVPIHELLYLCLWISIIGGIQALIAIIHAKLRHQPKTTGIPYAVAIFVGTLGYWGMQFIV